MARRIEIELTSPRPDGTWNWRAKGAREPRGVLDGDLLPEGAGAGEVLRVEAEFGIEGIVVTGIVAGRDKKRSEPARIELIAPSGADLPGVTTQLAGRSGRGERSRDRDGFGGRDGGSGGGDRPRREGPSGRDRGASGRPEGAARQGDGPRRDGSRPTGAHGSGEGAGPPRRTDRSVASDGGRPSERRDGAEGKPAAASTARPGSSPRRDGGPRDGGPRNGGPREGGAHQEAVRSRKLSPSHVHRNAVMAALPAEEQAVADQVLRGGVPAVRTALHLERERATAEGRPVPDTQELVTLAESLLPRLQAAEWRDRAEAAVKLGDDITMRDLRSVVAGADVARDEESRALAATLRTSLDGRVEGARTSWTSDTARHLDEGRVVRALQLAGRPPDPGARLDADLATRIADAAGSAMAADTPPDRWLALLEAVAASPVRRSVTPAALPAEPGADLLRAAHQQSGRVPTLAAMLGITIPPPPGPRAGSAPRRPPQPPARGRRSGPPRVAPDPPTAPTSELAPAVPTTAPSPATDESAGDVAAAGGQPSAPSPHQDPIASDRPVEAEPAAVRSADGSATPTAETPAANEDGHPPAHAEPAEMAQAGSADEDHAEPAGVGKRGSGAG